LRRPSRIQPASAASDGADDPALGRVEVDPAPAPFVTGWEEVR
jgi:hypothetical protein